MLIFLPVRGEKKRKAKDRKIAVPFLSVLYFPPILHVRDLCVCESVSSNNKRIVHVYCRQLGEKICTPIQRQIKNNNKLEFLV